MTAFDTDPFPGRPKILFVGPAYSSHVTDWINTLEGAQFNIRLFAIPHTRPPEDWPVRTYVTGAGQTASIQDSDTRRRMYPALPAMTHPSWLFKRLELRRLYRSSSPEKWLAEIIQTWRPDIIQTLSFTPASRYFLQVYQQHDIQGIAKWMAMLFGSSDIETEKHHPEHREVYQQIIRSVDYVMGDSDHCLQSARELGLREDQIPGHPKVPAAGGVPVDERAPQWQATPPSKRRMLLWSKAYDGFFVSSQCVFEAIKLCWDDIQPCELVVPGLREGSSRWYWTLPEKILQSSRAPALMPHAEFVQLMLQARVLLMPSLLEGLPNALVDAMSCGTFPIVSPLPDLKEVLEDEKNTLFAHNLYPQEIAAAITRAMNDDALVDSAAQNNLALVRRIANREDVRQKLIENYEIIARENRQSS